METSPHCIVSRPGSRWRLWPLLPLTAAVLLVHGYHPLAEDGGMYVAGVEYKLDPSLFPHETAFATAQIHYSLFASALAQLTRHLHLPLSVVLLLLYLLSTSLMLLAAFRIAATFFASLPAQWTAVALLAAGWTLPLAATSLMLMDPYLTARSLSTPLSLLAVSLALCPWNRLHWGSLHTHPALRCGLLLALAAVFHPLMAAYSVAFVLIVRLAMQPAPRWLWLSAFAAIVAAAALLQRTASPETPAALAACHSRYYWFLSQWRWFEWLGLLGPLGVYAALLRWARGSLRIEALALCRASLLTGLLAMSVALLFAQEHFPAHPVARLQPLRLFLLPYLLMLLLLGGLVTQALERVPPPRNTALRSAPALLVALIAFIMFLVQRATFPGSIHLELPGRTNPNAWVQAFVWARQHTPVDALFALDARYVNTPGEDAQTFRAIAQRSAIPDFSKDGGEAANAPILAEEWQRSATATRDLSALTDADRDPRLAPFRVRWVVLHADAPTAHSCPYRNAVVKICRLP